MIRRQTLHHMSVLAIVGLGVGESLRSQTLKAVLPNSRPVHESKHRPLGSFITAPSRLLPYRSQCGYGMDEIAFARGDILALALKPAPAHRRWVNPGITVTLSVAMSHGPLSPVAFSWEFPRNHGADKTTVFTGKVYFPEWKGSQDSSKYLAHIVLQKPFAFDKSKGKSLVIDVRATETTYAARTWFYDQAITDWGGWLVHSNHEGAPGCDPTGRKGVYSFGVNFTAKYLVPGGSWWGTWVGLAPNRVGFASIGFVGVGGKWGPFTLPIRLPGECLWGVATEILWPFAIDSTGTAKMPPLPIPNDRRLVGKTFFDQAGVFIPSANVLGLTTCFSSQWVIGSGHQPNIITLVRSRDGGTKWAGGRIPHLAPRFQITYRKP